MNHLHIRRTLKIAILAIFAVGMVMGTRVHAQAGISLTDPLPSPGVIRKAENMMQQAQNAADSAKRTIEQGKAAVASINDTIDQSGAKGIVTRVWGAIKSFFADKGMRDLTVDTVKLGLRVVANIFTIIASLITKVLEMA